MTLARPFVWELPGNSSTKAYTTDQSSLKVIDTKWRSLSTNGKRTHFYGYRHLQDYPESFQEVTRWEKVRERFSVG